MKLFAFVAATLLVAASAAPTMTRMHPVKEELKVPAGWSATQPAPADMPITLTVAVKQTNTDVLEETLIRISDPDHADFNKLLTNEEVNELVAPRPESIAKVLGWIKDHGIDITTIDSTPNSDMMSFETTIAVAEKMLETKYFDFEHSTGLHAVRMSSAYTIPAGVHEHVDFVGPSVRFPVPFYRPEVPAPAAGELGVTPDFLKQIYNSQGVEASASGNLQACAQFLGQYYSPSDLQKFFTSFYAKAEGRTVKHEIGPNDASNPGMEATLDIEYIMSMGANVPTDFWSTAGQQPHNPQNEPFLLFLGNLSSTPDASQPKTISTSYGDNEDGVWMEYAVRVNTEFQKAGARGISLMFSSGDGGVAGGQPTSCTKFIPTFPAGSPWVTAVGGSQNSNPETAAGLSSGGFSNYWARPSWQNSAVAGYIKSASNLPDKSLFNQTGAGFPDVAAQAENFNIVVNGFTTFVSGTSCSSPSFTGVLSLVNDARMAAGKKSLGFLNQIIYKNAAAFNDITSGSNPGCGTNGFEAAAGWDPVTGFGTPNYQKLKAVAMALP